MLLWRHPDSGLFWDIELVKRRAAVEAGPVSTERAIEEAEDDGFERVWLEDDCWSEGTDSLNVAHLTILKSIADGIGRIADSETHPVPRKVASPYFTKEEAARSRSRE